MGFGKRYVVETHTGRLWVRKAGCCQRPGRDHFCETVCVSLLFSVGVNFSLSQRKEIPHLNMSVA